MIFVDSIRKNRKPKSENEPEADEDWKYGSD